MQWVSLAIVHECIHFLSWKLNQVSQVALSLHLKIAAELSRTDWERMDRSVTAWTETLMGRVSQRQIKKFERLVRSVQSSSPSSLYGARTVVNLCSKELDEATFFWSVLAKGLNFAMAPWRLPMKEIICGIELPPLPSGVEEIRGEMCHNLRIRVTKK